MPGPRVQNVGRTTGATPIAEDFLRQIAGTLAPNAPVGPQQREAGTAIGQFIKSLQQRQAGGPGQQIDPSGLISAIQQDVGVTANRQAGDLREAFGAQGNRFGTSLAQGEARLRGDIGRGLSTDIANTRLGAEQFNIGSAIQQQGMTDQLLLQGISELFGQGQAGQQNQLALASILGPLGILPPETVVSPSVGQQVISGLISGGSQAASAYLGRPR